MSRQHARQLESEFLARGDAIGWFEALYAEADSNYSTVPWADLEPNPNLVEWVTKQNLVGSDKTALKIGCGYGDDAEFLSKMGFKVVAFDISATAISECKQRFPSSRVLYQVADLLNPPEAWFKSFSLVLESYTLQVLPPNLRVIAISNIVKLVAPSGQVLVITRGQEESESCREMPYPLTRLELKQFEHLGLKSQMFEDYYDIENPPVRRFRACYTPTNAT